MADVDLDVDVLHRAGERYGQVAQKRGYDRSSTLSASETRRIVIPETGDGVRNGRPVYLGLGYSRR
jgi:hypothetical protein